MRTKLFAISAILAAAMTATIAVGNWPAMPLALNPVTVDQNKNVTVDFVNAPASEVLAWLKKAGVNFVIDTEDVPQDKRLTVHIKNQPMDKAIEAIADALGLGWTKKGNIYTLKQGGFGNWTTFSPDSKAFKVLGDKDGQTWKFSPEDSKKWEEFGKEMGEKFKDFDWKQGDGRVFQWDGEKMKEWEGKLKDMPKFEFKELPEGTFKMDEKQWEKFSKDWESFGEKFGEQFKDMPEWKGLDDKQLEELHEKLKDMPKLQLDNKQMKELHEKLKSMPKIQLDGKQMKELREKMKDMPKIDGELMKKLKDLPDIKVPMSDLGKLIESLTPAQLEKNKSKGYLTPEDLTPEQRKMLGDWSRDADFNIVVTREGKTITLKGK